MKIEDLKNADTFNAQSIINAQVELENAEAGLKALEALKEELF